MTGTRPALRSLWLADPATLRIGDPREAPAPDAVVLDAAALRADGIGALSDLVAQARSRAARHWVVVRLSPLDSGQVDPELDALRSAWPDAVLLPACDDGRAIQQCGVKLAVREAEAGRPAGSTAIIAAPSLLGYLAPGGFAGASDRLHALTWDRTEVEQALGAAPGILGPGGDAAAASLLPALLLLAARAAGVAAYDTVSDRADPLFSAECRAARNLGFDGKIGREPRQIATIDPVFTPTRAVSAGG